MNATYSMKQFSIDTVMTIWHYHGGCQVGRVVDPDYRVIGVDALRVIDGSTFQFHNSPGTNPQATVYGTENTRGASSSVMAINRT
ncbi:hypothetical protein BUALT_Bualt06G0118300 [Buddleja alternifolia]|uniref:Glucose-methanol-choline oxidoreductase C-terminal domain-containing protein n=1 Tax=Buddleja alternifolia TaxID=168488 RepID=A0AAV6XE62_9LAMI|nr:hypothetical protein BUALT_Bualt06G0118300 [Buddleja alternifolia]